ncbi:MAG TPA: adenosine kinase [Rhizomicrobium sp.]
MGHDVAAIGHALVDVLASVPDQFLLDHAIAKGVMTMIDEYRASTLYAALEGPREVAGGSAANTLAGLASFGGTGFFIGKVKDDRLGGSFSASMAETGLDFTVARAIDGEQTGCCVIAVTADGERSMNTYLGAASRLAPEDVDADAVAACKALYIEGYMWDVPNAKAAINKAIVAAKAAKVPIALTLSDPFCVGRFRDEFLQLLRGALDLVFANEEEIKALFEVATFDEALQALKDWKGIAALTRSEKGCVVKRGDELHAVDAVPVNRVVDTTGAGDQFAAGFLYGLTHGMWLADCGRLGCLGAAECISHYGARPEVNLRELAAKAGLIRQ